MPSTATPAVRRRRCRRCASKGNGQLVYNADEFRWGNIYYHRSTDRFAPHNVYTTGKELRKLAKRIGAEDKAQKAAWQFAPDAPLGSRPKGGADLGGLRLEHDHLPLRPQDQHLHAIGQRAKTADRPRDGKRWRPRTSS